MNNDKKSYNLFLFVGNNCRFGNMVYMYYNIYVSKFFILLVINVKVFIIIFIVYIYFDMFLYCIVFELEFFCCIREFDKKIFSRRSFRKLVIRN